MRYTLLLITALCLFSFNTNAQTVDEIIDQYIETTGGLDAWSELEGIKMYASVNNQGMEIPIEYFLFKDGRQFMKLTLQGKEIVDTAFDGEEAWSTNFMTGNAEKSTAEDVENMKREMGNFPDPFINYKEKSYSCELMGTETVEGVDCHKIKITKTPLLVDGVETPNVVFHYFDMDNLVPIVSESEITSGDMKGQTQVSVFSDFQEVDGLYFPFSIENKLKGTDQSQMFMISKIELNPTLDPAVFVMPAVIEKVEKVEEGKRIN